MMGEITKKLNKAGFKRLTFEIPPNSKNIMSLSDIIPNVKFTSDNFDIDIFENKQLVKISTKAKSRSLGDDCSMEIQEIIPYKKMSLEDFNKMMKYPIELILHSGNN